MANDRAIHANICFCVQLVQFSPLLSLNSYRLAEEKGANIYGPGRLHVFQRTEIENSTKRRYIKRKGKIKPMHKENTETHKQD